jgi:hypothetical protein
VEGRKKKRKVSAETFLFFFLPSTKAHLFVACIKITLVILSSGAVFQGAQCRNDNITLVILTKKGGGDAKRKGKEKENKKKRDVPWDITLCFRPKVWGLVIRLLKIRDREGSEKEPTG